MHNEENKTPEQETTAEEVKEVTPAEVTLTDNDVPEDASSTIPSGPPTDATEVLEAPMPEVPVGEYPDIVGQGEDITVIADNPQQMVQAQLDLIQACDRKIAAARQALQERQENLDAALRGKLRTTVWRRLVKEAEAAVVYYEKMKTAFSLGYFMVPDFPITLIAIRTDNKPAAKQTRLAHRGLQAEDALNLPRGEGRYVHPIPSGTTYQERTSPSTEPARYTQYVTTTGDYKPVDFPMRLVKPRIVNNLTEALARKVFDEVGILPSSVAPARRSRTGLTAGASANPDPMVIGRIFRQDRGHRISASFLITWWIDANTL